jgi:hypothetical protein
MGWSRGAGTRLHGLRLWDWAGGRRRFRGWSLCKRSQHGQQRCGNKRRACESAHKSLQSAKHFAMTANKARHGKQVNEVEIVSGTLRSV